MKRISSRANAQFKHFRELASDARRQLAEGLCLIDGVHLIAAYREKCGLPECLLLSEHGMAQPEIKALVEAFDRQVECLLMPDPLFAALSQLATPPGIMACVRIPEVRTEMPAGASCVLLDAIQDAGNVGTILRTAAAAGVRDVFLGPGCAHAWSPRTLRAAQGAHFDLAICQQANLEAMARNFSGLVLAATAGRGETLFELDLRQPIAWIFGNEGSGVSPQLVAVAARQVRIPLASGSESLNVAAAAAICLFEELRQKRFSAR